MWRWSYAYYYIALNIFNILVQLCWLFRPIWQLFSLSFEFWYIYICCLSKRSWFCARDNKIILIILVTRYVNISCYKMCCRSKKIPMNSNTNYRRETQLVPISMDYCVLPFGALKFSLGVRLYERSLPDFNFFNVNPHIWQ